MATRHFEFVGADAARGTEASAKFWEISIDGATVTVRFGKIGTNGQTTVKELGTAEAAEKESAKLIADKTKKGYVEK